MHRSPHGRVGGAEAAQNPRHLVQLRLVTARGQALLVCKWRGRSSGCSLETLWTLKPTIQRLEKQMRQCVYVELRQVLVATVATAEDDLQPLVDILGTENECR